MTLFINGCMREGSRTLDLARAVLAKLGGDTVEEVCLATDGPAGLTPETLQLRNEILDREDFDHPMLSFARQFAAADTIVLAAPYWDLLFPAAVRAYLEAITVGGVTFRYDEHGVPQSLCRAKRLVYVTTAGGPIIRNFGFEYVEAVAKGFFGIEDVRCVCAEGLDIWGADVDEIMAKAKENLPAF